MNKKWFQQKPRIDMDSAGSVPSAESKGKGLAAGRLGTESTEGPPQLGLQPLLFCDIPRVSTNKIPTLPGCTRTRHRSESLVS